jgi:hypothetical protein
VASRVVLSSIELVVVEVPTILAVLHVFPQFIQCIVFWGISVRIIRLSFFHFHPLLAGGGTR